MADAPSRVFVANLDAEHELIDPQRRRSARMRAEIVERAAKLRESFLLAHGCEPVLVVDANDRVDPSAVQPTGDCWSPTPAAIALLRALCIEPPPAPSEEVLRRVNHRAFASDLGLGLRDACFARDVDTVLAALRTHPARRFVLKRALSFAGRSRKVLCTAELDTPTLTWIRASMTGHGGGLAVEPFVEVVADFSLHGQIERDGDFALGRPVRLDNVDGAFVTSRRVAADELDTDELLRLESAAAAVATALFADGYFGPFGIDAFRWRDESGATHFHPLCEVNARHTMAWWTGMAGRIVAD